MSELPPHVTALRRGLAEKDLDRVLNAQRALSDDSLVELLDQLVTALENEQYEDAETLLDQIAVRYESQRPADNATVAKVEAVRTSKTSSLDTIQDLTGFLRTANETSLQRAKLLTQSQSLIAAQRDSTDQDSTPKRSTVVATVSETKQQEQSYKEAASRTESTVDSEPVPPALHLVDISVSQQAPTVGTTVTTSVTIENVGDSAVENVELTVTTPSGLETNQSVVSVGRIEARSETTASVTVTGQSAGSYSFFLDVTGDKGTQASDIVALSVISDSSLPETLRRFDTSGNEVIQFKEVVVAIEAFNNNSLIGGQPVTFRDVVRVIEAYNTAS